MNLKLHFMDSHLNYSPENIGDHSQEQGERFYNDKKVMEEKYEGNWDVNIRKE